MKTPTILIVEDEPKIAQLLVDYLERDQYKTHVVHDGALALDAFRKQNPDFVLLDLMLPNKDGLSICREIRQVSAVPIMMITAKVDEIDRLIGLESGADDYVCKPFSPREVVARVRIILRRLAVTPTTTENTLSYQNISLQLDKHICTIQGQAVDLTPVEFKLLKLFISQPGRVFSRGQLMDSCYPDGRIVSDRTIDTHIKNLRKKTLISPESEEVIQSIYGVGYKLL